MFFKMYSTYYPSYIFIHVLSLTHMVMMSYFNFFADLEEAWKNVVEVKSAVSFRIDLTELMVKVQCLWDVALKMNSMLLPLLIFVLGT